MVLLVWLWHYLPCLMCVFASRLNCNLILVNYTLPWSIVDVQITDGEPLGLK